MKFITACFIFIIFFYLAQKIVFAQSYNALQINQNTISEALVKNPYRLLPSNRIYPLIIIKESLMRAFKPSSAKRAEYDLVLSGKRLAETYALLNQARNQLAEKNLGRYSKQLKVTIAELEKARSQNQDIVSAVNEAADSLMEQEVLLSAIYKTNIGDSTGFNSAKEAFRDAVLRLNQMKPGVKDRFKSLKDVQEEIVPQEPANTSNEPDPLSSTASATPKRIIY